MTVRAFIVIFGVVLTLACTMPVKPAQAGFFEFLFPSLKQPDGPDPSETLQAPFAVSGDEDTGQDEGAGNAAKQALEAGVDIFGGAGVNGKPIMPENAIPLAQPHRSSAAIAQWIMTATSEAMMFDDADFNISLKDSKPYFSPQGRKQYLAFLKRDGVVDTLKSGGKDIRSFVKGQPVLLNEGAVDGRYKWLYDVELMLTYLNRGTTNYQNSVPVNKSVKVRVQIGRSPDAENRDEIWVETWTGKLSE